MRSRIVTFAAVTAATALILTGCSPSTTTSGDPIHDENTLRVLAGSEVKDMVPILEVAAEETGVKVAFEYAGTLDGTEQVASGAADGHFDATWFPNNSYLSLLPGAAAATGESVKVMSSPVSFGLGTDLATKLGWAETAPTWAQIAEAAAAGEFEYGMTNPSASNSGFSALVSVATALSGTGSALTEADISSVSPGLVSFFSGQKLTSGSSGWLAEQFLADQSAPGKSSVDGIVNYESVLMGLNDQGADLSIITPTDGVVTSDYPLTLLKSADADKKALFTTLTDWLTTPEAQQRIVNETHRRPGVTGIDTGTTFPSAMLFETPFPNTLETVNSLIGTYLSTVRKPAQTIFVLDTSGSMDGDRIGALQSALKDLAGADDSTTGSFAAFQNRERVTLLPFDSTPGTPVTVEIPETDKTAAFKRIRDTADSLSADGGTAVYDSLLQGYLAAMKQKEENPDTFVSVVLMTDGENTDGSTAADFDRQYSKFAGRAEGIPTFVVLFGNGDVEELTAIAEKTRGKVFDALDGDLSGAFREIRGYQ